MIGKRAIVIGTVLVVLIMSFSSVHAQGPSTSTPNDFDSIANTESIPNDQISDNITSSVRISEGFAENTNINTYTKENTKVTMNISFEGQTNQEPTIYVEKDMMIPKTNETENTTITANNQILEYTVDERFGTEWVSLNIPVEASTIEVKSQIPTGGSEDENDVFLIIGGIVLLSLVLFGFWRLIIRSRNTQDDINTS